MFTAEQYRAKADEFKAILTNTPHSPNETNELRNLEQTYTTLAENEEWIAVNIGKTIQRRKDHGDYAELAEEEEQILNCVGGGRDQAAEYCSHQASTGILRPRK